MSNKTINQALKDLYTGLGGDPQALADNSTCSDYIEDLESAIKGAASGAAEDLIDDEAASTATTYSSSMIESLIPTDELPEVTAEDIGDVLQVVSDGEEGAIWGKGEIVVPSELPSVTEADIGEALIVESDGEGGAQWTKGAIPTPESDTIFINCTYSGGFINLPSGTTGATIKSYIENGKKVFLDVGTTYGIMPFAGYHSIGGSNYMRFSTIIRDGYPDYTYKAVVAEVEPTSSPTATSTNIKAIS